MLWSSVRVFSSCSVWQSAAVWMLNLAASAPPLLDKAWHHLQALWLVERDAGSWWAGMAGSADRGWLTLCWKLVMISEKGILFCSFMQKKHYWVILVVFNKETDNIVLFFVMENWLLEHIIFQKCALWANIRTHYFISVWNWITCTASCAKPVLSGFGSCSKCHF